MIKEQNLVTKNAMELRQNQSSFANKKKKEALDMFKAMPMPREREEDWRYTEIEKLNLDNFDFSKSNAKIIVTNFGEDLIEKDVILTDINTALDKYPIAQEYFFKSTRVDKNKFVALSAAHFTNGIFLYVPKNVELEEPIKVNFIFDRQNSISHNMIVADGNSKLNFIEDYSSKESKDEQLNSCFTEVYAYDNSKINFYHLNRWQGNVYNFTNIVGAIGRDASLNWFSGCFGGKINRLIIDTIFQGQGSQCNNLGIFMGKDKEHIDFTTNMYHNTTNTTNDVLVDGILKDESSSVYRGLIKIEKEGQKTNSYLANHILKLGEKTLANSIPSLKIDANDVKASHGATVGQIDEEHMFYLMARGLSRAEAERLIVEGFFEPIIQKIPSEELREKIRELVK